MCRTLISILSIRISYIPLDYLDTDTIWNWILIYRYSLFHLVSEPLWSDADGQKISVMFSFLGQTKISQACYHKHETCIPCFISDPSPCRRSFLPPTLGRNLKLCNLTTIMLYQWVDIDYVDQILHFPYFHYTCF